VTVTIKIVFDTLQIHYLGGHCREILPREKLSIKSYASFCALRALTRSTHVTRGNETFALVQAPVRFFFFFFFFLDTKVLQDHVNGAGA